MQLLALLELVCMAFASISACGSERGDEDRYCIGWLLVGLEGGGEGGKGGGVGGRRVGGGRVVVLLLLLLRLL